MGQEVERNRDGAALDAPSKLCAGCGLEKPLSDFYSDTSKRLRVSSRCKSCHNQQQSIYRKENRPKIRAMQASWRQRNPEKKREAGRRWRIQSPEKARAADARYREKNKEAVSASRKKWADANPEYMAEKGRRASRKRLETPKGRINAAIRSAVYTCLKGGKGWRRTFDLLGYTSEELMSHLEKLFKPGMTWENYGLYGWEIDHIEPLSSFSFEDVTDEHFKRAWSLSNLQPLWMSENRKKSNRAATDKSP